MGNLKLLLAFLMFGLLANAQDHQQKFYSRDNRDWIIILNEEIIGSIDLLRTIPKNQIRDLNIHREEKLSSRDNLFHSDSNNSGLIIASTGYNFETKNQEELNEFFGLNSNNDLYVNGFLLENKKYKISSNSIARIEILEADGIFLDQRVLNITLK